MALDPEIWKEHRARSRYKVICNYRRGHDRVLFRGLIWSDADRIAERLQERYDQRHPGKSSWTKRLYSAPLDFTFNPENKMFTELKSMLRKGDTLAFTVAFENETQLRVNIHPKLFTMDGENGADRKALNQPVSFVATPAELDSPAFIEQLNRFTGSTNDLRHTLDQVEAAHRLAKEAKKGSKAAPAKRDVADEVGPKDKAAKVKAPEPEEPPTAEEATAEII